MGKILEYILGLNFIEKPNYLMMKNAIELILNKLNFSNDLQFDWYNLDFLNYLYISENEYHEKENTKENKKEKSEEKDKNNNTNNISIKLNTINNINNYNAKKLKMSYNKNMDNTNNSYIRNKNNNNQIKQERSKSLLALKRMYAQKMSNKINSDYKKIKTYIEDKKDIGKQYNRIFNGKENIKIKNLRVKK